MCSAAPFALAGDLFDHARRYRTDPGQEVRIGAHVRLDRRCQPTGQPLIRILDAPQHGSVVTRPSTHVIRHTVGSASCDGREAPGLDVFYTPAAEYHGVDHIRYAVYFSNDTLTETVDVIVR